jgi:hypothetical protein
MIHMLNHRNPILFYGTICCVGAAGASIALAAAAASLVHRTDREVSFEVTSAGLSRITFQGRPLATGEWTVFNAESWFTQGGASGPIGKRECRKRMLEIISPAHAVVRQQWDDLLCTFDYTFAGEDVTISARVENQHPDAPLEMTGFSGLTFTFDRPPTGLHHAMHPTYSQAHGIKICHPSIQNKIGGSYAADYSVGVGVTPWKTGLERTLILFDYGSWAADKRDNDPERKLLFFCPTPIPPRGARTFDLRLRVSPNRDWQHLLAPYREHFQNTFGPVRYTADPRWIATDYLNHSQQAVSETNPYGFHGGYRRIDTAEGAAKFCDFILPALKANDGQGVIVWGQGGDDPRGGMYRPDFDVLPPEVETQWTNILAPRFREAGVRLGVTTRPHDMAVKLDWKQDVIIGINPDDPSHREMLWRRFDNMIKLGCTLFYLDSFGDSLEDVKLMRWLREKLGPDVRTYCEHQCDAIAPFSGGYSETTLHAEPQDGPPHYRLWSGVKEWEIYRWLCPGAEISTRLHDVKGQPPAGMESVDRWCARNEIIPLVTINDFRRGPEIKSLQGQAPWRDTRRNRSEKDGTDIVYFNIQPERPDAEVAQARAEIPPVNYAPPPERWDALPVSRVRLAETNGTWRVVMLGDSICNDTWRSRYGELLQEHLPHTKLELTAVVGGGKGCYWYQHENRVVRYVVPLQPDLLIVAGISHSNDIEGIRKVIRETRAVRPCDVLLCTGPFGDVDPTNTEQWAKERADDPNSWHVRLAALAREEKAAFLDVQLLWGDYTRASGKPVDWFKRDPIHANARGEAALGRFMTAYLSP